MGHGLFTRGARGAALVVGGALLLAGCGTSPGVGVAVGDVSYSTQDVYAQVDEVVGDAVAGDTDARAFYVRKQATALIRHQIVRDVAAKQGIVVTDADVNQQIESYDDYQRANADQPMNVRLGVPQSGLRDAVYDLVVFSQLSTAIPADGVDVTDVQVVVDVVPVADWTTASTARARYAANPAAMDADAAAARAADPQLPGGTQSLLQNSQNAVFGIFSAPAGEIVIVANGQSGYLLVRVTSRTEQPGKLTPDLIQGVYQSAGLDAEIGLTSLLLSQEAEAASVTVNPRLGVWDPRVMQVVPSA